MNPVAPLAPFGQPPREFVNDHNLAFLHDILPIKMKVAVHFDRPFDVLIQINQANGTQNVGLGQGTNELAALRGQFHFLRVIVDLVMHVLLEARRVLRGPLVGRFDLLADLVSQRTDDQRRSRLVDQDAVRFVNQTEIGRALNRLIALALQAMLAHPDDKIFLAKTKSPQQQSIA